MRFARYDVFVKTEKNIQNMTSSGGILTIGVAVVLAYLGLYEAAIYFSPKMSFEFKVDSERSVGHALNLNIDVTVAMSCDYVRADLVDSSGESMQLENVFKKERKVQGVISNPSPTLSISQN